MQNVPHDTCLGGYRTSARIAGLACLVPALSVMAQQPDRVLVEEWRLGGPDGRGAAAFTSEPAVVVERRGKLYTRGSRDSHISVFDSTGTFLRTIGRRGQGPGEFFVVSGHGFVGDTLWAADARSRAISTFDANGRHLETRRVIVELAERFAGAVGVSALLSNGRAIVIPSDAPMDADGRLTVPVLIGDRQMHSRDTLLSMVRPEYLFVPRVGTFWWIPVVIPPRIDVAPDGTGILVVNWERNGEEVEVRRLNPDGRARWRRTLTLPSPMIDSRARDSIVDRAMQMAAVQVEASKRRGEVARGVSTRSLVESGLDLPDRYPPVTHAVLGVDGAVWLQRGGPGPARRWSVLDSAGTRLFDVTSSLPLTVQEATRDVVWATFSDEDGFPYLIRYRVWARD